MSTVYLIPTKIISTIQKTPLQKSNLNVLIVNPFICYRLHTPLKRGFFRNIFTPYYQNVTESVCGQVKDFFLINSKLKNSQKKTFEIRNIKKNVTNYELVLNSKVLVPTKFSVKIYNYS